MGGKNTYPRIDLEITPEKISNLETSIKIFMDNQSENIKRFFKEKKYKKQTIEYKIDALNNNIQTESDDDATFHTDYVIQWTIEGSHFSNTTNCQLTFFNIGGLLGANGFLYQISMFYYYFMKIPINNRTQENIQKDIDDCLKLIDQSNIIKLNARWNVHLNGKYLNNLKAAKDFLMNLFHEHLTDSIFSHINNSIIHRIWKFCKKKFRNFGVILFYGLTKRLTKNEYIKEKNKINRDYLIKKIFENLNLETFSKYNLFIIASDNDIDSWTNYGATFYGYHLIGGTPYAKNYLLMLKMVLIQEIMMIAKIKNYMIFILKKLMT